MAPDRSWIIGADPGCDLVVDRPTVSGRHCRLERIGGGYRVEDLGSTNGTFVNGRLINRLTPVSMPDAITLGLGVPMPWPVDEREDDARSVIRIGRDPDNDVVLDEAVVSGRHARILLGGRGAVIEDLGSSNGTSLNAPGRRIDRAPLSASDVVYFGSLAVPAARLLSSGPPPIGEPGGADRPRLTLSAPAMVLGRGSDCDRVLDEPTISEHHARIWRSGGSAYLEDLGSSNGTFLNGRRLGRRPVTVRTGDVIGLGSCEFAASIEHDPARRSSPGRVVVEARGVGVDLGRSTVIDGVSMRLGPSALVGLMGPSGSGKTTLLRALVGDTRPSRGAVLYNGVDVHEHDGGARRGIGYVPQDDVVHRELTVGQALRFSGRLRMPGGANGPEVERRVRSVLGRLGLSDTERVPIGPAEGGGISGGQRKRVNLAIELLADPAALMLDEPTSGLSSEDALMVMRLLRRLADEGRTVFLTIHQPGLDAFRLLDDLAVIARDAGSGRPGRLAYYGPAYPGALEFFEPDAKPGVPPSSDEILRALPRQPADAWADRFARSVPPVEFASSPSGRPPEPPGVPPTAADRLRHAASQWYTLVCRNLAIKAADRGNTLALLTQAPVIAILIVLVFGRGAAAETTGESWPEVSKMVGSTTFVLGLSALWFGCSGAIREIVGERAVYRRERMSGLGLGPYLASKFTVLGAIGLVQSVVLLAVVHAGSGLRGPLLPMFGLLLLSALVGVAIGLAISAASRTTEVAIALVPLILLPLLLLGGSLRPRHDLPTPIRQASDLIPARWAYEGLLTLEAGRRPTWRPPASVDLPGRRPGPTPEIRDMAEHSFPGRTERMGPRASALALATMLVALCGLIALILRSRDGA
ncbi:FHA domain-containing protein [Tautonia plasticadhaerens]|uniref:ABC transporter ATP-binding/permease protein n=1 Tax=Tautonia plasticadhaerens TaxID=2527974 RepID=A0A518GVG1_9BACT|nr:FHA domain-containing protein [Tautonia plasticadhaerens]QDV32585.1 ABC transporter ATP-binding/permease protein [Tautonia plasticadhaerens]